MNRNFINRLILVIVLFFSGIVLPQLKWKRVGIMPWPVSGGQVIFDISNTKNTKMYILGGYSDSLQTAVDWIQEYDVVKNSWKMVGRMLQPRDQFVADIWKNTAMYYGGTTTNSTDKTSLETWDYTITTNLASVYSRDKNFGRSFSTGQIVGDNFYLIGGNPSNPSDSLSYIVAYDLNTKTTGFTYQSPPANTFRQQMTYIVDNNIYIFGGVFNGVLNSIQKFNIPSKNLTTLPEKILEPRAGGAAIYHPLTKKGYLIGGYNEKENAMNSVEQVEIQADGSLKISRVDSMFYARTNLMAAPYHNGWIVVFGGRTDRGKSGKVVPYVELLYNDDVVDIKKENLPADFSLSQNYPNPFNPLTTINYSLSKKSFVQLKVFDLLGKEIVKLVDEEKNAGIYSEQFNAAKFNLPSGVYYYQIVVSDITNNGGILFLQTKKMVVLK